MEEGKHLQQRVLYIISCASPVARLVPELVLQAHASNWEVCVITTPLWSPRFVRTGRFSSSEQGRICDDLTFLSERYEMMIDEA